MQLIVSDDCEPCRLAEAVWRDACDGHGAELEIVDLDSPAGAGLGKSLELRSLPAVVMNGRLVAVGVQDRNQVDALLKRSGPHTGKRRTQD
ncbi:MAG: thioredoxin family protein [Gammaproteobacteria bacterium]